MMKNVVIIFVLLMTIGVSAQDRNPHPRMQQYYVNSDKRVDNIPDDQFLLKGHVKMFSSAVPIDAVLVSSGKDGKSVKTDSAGYFEMHLSDTIRKIFFYKEGWHEFVLEKYKFRNGHEIDITVYMGQSDAKQIMRKPMIYLYSNDTNEVTVKINPKGELIHSYPNYNGMWKVRLRSDHLIEHKKKKYPYLFWEAVTKDLQFVIEDNHVHGTVVPTKELTSFFEDKLTAMGLNEKEQADFITYWVPELNGSPYFLIQFLNTEQCNQFIGSLEIRPKADNLKRVYMLAAPLNGPEDYLPTVPQTFEAVNRSGFTAIEWGGTIIKLTPESF